MLKLDELIERQRADDDAGIGALIGRRVSDMDTSEYSMVERLLRRRRLWIDDKKIVQPERRGASKKIKIVTPVRSRDDEFDEFWQTSPNQTGKKRARTAYNKARKKVSAKALLDGYRRYIKTKPDGVQWCHPATWLNDERWDDRPAKGTAKPKTGVASLTDEERESLWEFVKAICPNECAAYNSPADHHRRLMNKHLKDWREDQGA